MSSLTRIVPWSQQLVCEVLQSGDLAIDLTAGKGRDTHALAAAVGPEGQVIAFDLQQEAIRQTSEYLDGHGLAASRWSIEQPLSPQPGLFLVHGCHSLLSRVVKVPVKGIIANLGYLPGGKQTLTTRPETTLAAINTALCLLAPGGRLAVTVYPAHPGGSEEGSSVEALLTALPGESWRVLSLRAANCPQAPFLLVAERLSLN